MPHRMRKPFYSTEEWRLMQAAHRVASNELGRSASSHENADRLARRVIVLFDRGLRDQAALAAAAASLERLASAIVARREGL
jgi:hypothetical protein